MSLSNGQTDASRAQDAIDPSLQEHRESNASLVSSSTTNALQQSDFDLHLGPDSKTTMGETGRFPDLGHLQFSHPLGTPINITDLPTDLPLGPDSPDLGSASEEGSRKRPRFSNKPETEEVALARKSSHREVEKRRREALNDGLQRLKNLVPGGEKNKQSIVEAAIAHIKKLEQTDAEKTQRTTLEYKLTEQRVRELTAERDLWMNRARLLLAQRDTLADAIRTNGGHVSFDEEPLSAVGPSPATAAVPKLPTQLAE